MCERERERELSTQARLNEPQPCERGAYGEEGERVRWVNGDEGGRGGGGGRRRRRRRRRGMEMEDVGGGDGWTSEEK